MAQNTEKILIKTPPLPNDPTMVDMLHYTKELESKKVEIMNVYKEKGKSGAMEFFKEESPQIYGGILHSERQTKRFLIVGGSMFVVGAGTATALALTIHPSESVGSFVAVSCCAGVGIIGAGLALAGWINGADAVRDGIILYKRAVDDEINDVKAYSGAIRKLSLGPTPSGYGLKLVF
ncbi:MAG: hypothetical protein LKK08_02185 [Bacteroidales bacterium]|nr:hypothetical protein [Bacteroidales bacterium]